MKECKWIEKYCEIISKTPDYKNEDDITYKKAMKDDFERYCKDKVIAFLRYLFYNRSMTPFSSSLSIYKPRGTMFKDRRIDIGDYVVTDTLVERTRFEKRNYEKDDVVNYVVAKYDFFEAISLLFKTDEYHKNIGYMKFYKGFFFIKDHEITDKNETSAEVTEAFIRFMKAGFSIEYYENSEKRYSPNKPIAIFNSRNSEEEQDLFLYLILKYDELSPQDHQMLNRDHWEILDYEWRKELFRKLWRVLKSKKWFQCSGYIDMLCNKLLYPAVYRFNAARYIISLHTDEKKEIIDDFVALDETKQQNIFTAIEKNCYDNLDESTKMWCNIVIELDEYAEKLLLEQEDMIKQESEERNNDHDMRLSKKEEYTKAERLQKKKDSQTCNIADYPPWIIVSSFDEAELEEAIKNCKQQNLINVAKFLGNYSFPISSAEIERLRNEDKKEIEYNYKIAKSVQKQIEE